MAEPVEIFTRGKSGGGKYRDIYIGEEIVSPDNYNLVINTLRSVAKPKDSITMYLNSGGGDLDASIALINSVKVCKAKVNIVVLGSVSSSAAFLALAGSSLVLDPQTHLMFHTSSITVSSLPIHHGINLFSTGDRIISSIYQKVCSPFLTKEEINYILNGGELYVLHDDPNLKDRMKRHFNIYNR